MATYDNKVLTGDQLVTLVGKIKSALSDKQDTIDASHKLSTSLVDTSASANFVSSAEKATWSGKQDALTFNTAYNATTNKVATMADIPDVDGLDSALQAVSSAVDSISADYVSSSAIADFVTATDIGYDDQDPFAKGSDLEGLAQDIANAAIPSEGMAFWEYDPYDAEAQPATASQLWASTTIYSDVQGADQVLSEWLTTPNMLAEDVVVSYTAPVYEDVIDPETGEPVVDPETGEPTGERELVTPAVYTTLEDKLDEIDTAIAAKPSLSAVNSAIATAISGIGSFHFEIVQTLPQSNISTSTIYLVLKSSGPSGNVYTEYAYINNNWEIIGDTQADISTLSTTDINTIWANTSAT